MEKQPSKTEKAFIRIGAIMGWFAVVFQLYLFVVNRTAPVPETIIRFFSYYTILTNILVALCFTMLWQEWRTGQRSFFTKPATLTATLVYILAVGITYNFILRGIWAPQGWQRVVDELLHLVIPIWFLLYWFLFASKAGLRWNHILPWLIYPACYLVYILFRGAVSGFYPYPFVDVTVLGYQRVFLHSAGLFIAFLLLSLLFVGIAKRMQQANKNGAPQ